MARSFSRALAVHLKSETCYLPRLLEPGRDLRTIFWCGKKGRTRLFWIGKFNSGKFGIRVLLLFHGDEGLEAKALKASTKECIADAVHRSIDKLNVR